MALPTSSTVDIREDRTIGSIRRIDQLGRIVVPAELRRVTGIQTGDLVEIRLVDGHIALTKIAAECALCGCRDELVDHGTKQLCTECVREIKAS